MERRNAERHVPDGGEPLARMRLRTGSELAVVNVSTCGALVEGSVRLLPGRHLEVHVATREGRLLVRCRVTRSFVWRLAFDAVCYRSALAFERNLDAAAVGQQFPLFGPGRVGGASSSYPEPSRSDAVDAAVGASA